MSKAEIYSGLPFRYSIKKTDLVAAIHNHTRESDGLYTPERQVEGALEAGINTLIITDHETVLGGEKGKSYAAKRDYLNRTHDSETHFDVLVGQELTTKENGKDAHMLVIWPEEQKICLPYHQSPEETAYLAKEAGALVIAPHPASQVTSGMSWEKVYELRGFGLLDALEYNGAEESVSHLRSILDSLPFGRFLEKKFVTGDSDGSPNRHVVEHARNLDLPLVGGQDAHLDKAHCLKKVVTLHPQETSFVEAVKSGNVKVHSEFEPEFWGPITIFKQRKLSAKLEEKRRDGTLV